MRGDRSRSQLSHELGHVIGLVRTQGDAASAAILATIDQFQRLVPLRRTGCPAHATTDRQAVAVLHQSVPHIAELGRLAVPLLIEPRIGVGDAAVGFVGALLPMKVPFGVAARTLAVVVAPILPAEALDRGPGLDQRTVHREVIAGQQPLHLRLHQHRLQELAGDLSLEQPVAVLREG